MSRMYGGSHNTLEPSFDYGGSTGNFNYFVSGDYNTNSLGIESPDATHTPAARPHQAMAWLRLRPGYSGPEQQRHRGAGHLQRHVRDSQPGRAFSPRASAASWAWDRWIPAAAATICCRPTARPRFRRAIGRAPARDHPLRQRSAICVRRAAWTSSYRVFGRYSSLFYHAGRQQSGRPALQRHRASRLQARRRLWHPGRRRLASGSTIRCGSACSTKPTI